MNIVPAYISATALAATPAPLTASSRLVRSALITKKAGNVGLVYIGPATVDQQLFVVSSSGISLPIGGTQDYYDLNHLYLKTLNDGDGVDILVYAP